MREEAQPILEVKGLKKYYDVTDHWLTKNRKVLRAVDGVDFVVNKGETLGIVGESGCGKSTLANLVMKLLEPTEGQIIFDGEDLNRLNWRQLRKKRAQLQMIFQDPVSSLNPRMRVFEIIAEPLRAHKAASGRELRSQVEQLLGAVGLDASYANRYPHEFSGGQRQRIGIARALALKPKLIVCDEPVSALDVSIQAQILNLLAKLKKEYQLTYIFIGHGLPAVKHISDKIAVMYLGKIVEIAPKEELFAQPGHPYTEGLLSAIPIPDPALRNKTKKVVLEGDLPNAVNLPPGCRFHTRCPYAADQCRREEPALREVRKGHLAACHFPLTDNKNGRGDH